MSRAPALASFAVRIGAPLIAIGVLAAAAHAAGPAASGTPDWSLAGPWRATRKLQNRLDFLDGMLTLPLGDGLRLQTLLGWRPGSEPMREANAFDRGREPWLQTGLRWTAIADRLFIDGGMGAGTRGPQSVQLTLGLKLAL
jgi:hypothetical protein